MFGGRKYKDCDTGDNPLIHKHNNARGRKLLFLTCVHGHERVEVFNDVFDQVQNVDWSCGNCVIVAEP